MAAAAAAAAQLQKDQGKKLSDAQIVAIAVRAEFNVGWQALKLRHEGWLEVHSCTCLETVFCHTMESQLEAYIIEMADAGFDFD